MKISNLIYNQIVYNHRFKKAAGRFLDNPFINKNPIYLYYYNKVMARKMENYQETPFRVMIENTNICNADCVFCPHKIMKRKTGIMEMGLFKKIADECQRLGIGYVTVYGFGEPLLDKSFFDRINYCKSLGIPRVTTNTNAMYFDTKKIGQVFDSGLDEIYISFDAATERTYKKIRPGLDFSVVENNIFSLINEKRKRNSAKPEIILSFVESSLNASETHKYIKKWQGKADHVSISYIHNWTGDVTYGIKNLTKKRDPCRLLWTDMVISVNGDVPLCCNDYENKVILGNIKKQSIKEIWGGKRLACIRKFHRFGQFTNAGICSRCTYNSHSKSPWWIGK